MKQFILSLFLISLIYSQPVIKTTPQIHDWETIYNGVLGDGGDGADTTIAFSAKQWAGHVAMALDFDSTGYGDDDSCKVIRIQYKHASMEWGGYYTTGSSSINYVQLPDTIARSVQAATVYIDLAKEISETSAEKGFPAVDSLRFIIMNGVEDSIGLQIDIGGQ